MPNVFMVPALAAPTATGVDSGDAGRSPRVACGCATVAPFCAPVAVFV